MDRVNGTFVSGAQTPGQWVQDVLQAKEAELAASREEEAMLSWRLMERRHQLEDMEAELQEVREDLRVYRGGYQSLLDTYLKVPRWLRWLCQRLRK